MLIFGFTFFGDDSCPTPVFVGSSDTYTYAQIGNGRYDDLYATHDLEDEPNESIPETKINYDDPDAGWTNSTIMLAYYDSTTDAGNTEWSVDTVSKLVIKRAEVSEFASDGSVSGIGSWVYLKQFPITTIDDFNINGLDVSARPNTTYVYAIVPVSATGEEGEYTYVTADIEMQGVCITDLDESYYTFIGGNLVDTTRNVPSTVLSLLNYKYGVYCSNSIANYDTGTCSGTFVSRNIKECTYDFDTLTTMHRKVMEFLANRKPKILKTWDGREWMIMVTGSPTDTGKDYIYDREISFEWAEIGDVNSNRDLYYAGLSNVTSDLW